LDQKVVCDLVRNGLGAVVPENFLHVVPIIISKPIDEIYPGILIYLTKVLGFGETHSCGRVADLE